MVTVVLLAIAGVIAAGGLVLLYLGSFGPTGELLLRTRLRIAVAAKDLTGIEESASQLLAANPADSEAHRELLWAKLLSGQHEDAYTLILSYMIASGGVVGHSIDTTLRIAEVGQEELALKTLDFILAEIEAGTGFSARWRQVTRNSLGRLQDTGFYNTYSARGDIYARLGDTEAAIANYRAAIEALPTFFFGYEKLIRYLFGQGDIVGAVEVLTQGERRGVLSLMFYVRLAQEYFYAGEQQAWILLLLDYSHRYDDIPYYGWFVEGCVYRAAGDTDAARRAMEMWKALRPLDAHTVESLLAACDTPESPLFWHTDPLFESSPNYYGMEE
jgi:tetratricopeptide (TPR) repeat protein